MSEKIRLEPSEVTDGEILAKCKQALNEWSAGLAFSLTRTLGDDTTLVKATTYHTYGLKLESRWTHRAFELEEKGKPVPSPRAIESYGLWDTGICGLDEDKEVDLADTCYREECETCRGDGKIECPTCNGQREITCPKCGGSGRTKCYTCWGKGEEPCKKCCRGGLWKGDGVCPVCHGTKVQTCSSCRGQGTHPCKKCGQRGIVTCDECNGKGIVTCGDCDGRGWNPHMWVLKQEQKDDEFEKVWSDEGLPKFSDELDDYEKYAKKALIDSEETGGKRADQTLADGFEAAFWDELKAEWKEADGKLAMGEGEKEGDLFRYQHAVVTQFDAAVKYDYEYKGKTYTIWIDLTENKLYEGAENGLMAEWAKEVSKGGDAAAEKGDVPEAMHYYTMACVISDQDAEISIRANKLINRQAWHFRLAAALTMAIWWGGYSCAAQGTAQGALAGMAAAGLYVLFDWMAMQRPIWLFAIGNLGVLAAASAGFQTVFGESGYVNAEQQRFLVACGMSAGSLSLLLGHDLAPRLRPDSLGIKPFKNLKREHLLAGLGALAGWAASPAIMVGCSALAGFDLVAFAAQGVAVALMLIAFWRTRGRLRIIDCGKWVDKMKSAEKQRAFVGTFKQLKPAWPAKVLTLLLAAWIPASLAIGIAVWSIGSGSAQTPTVPPSAEATVSGEEATDKASTNATEAAEGAATNGVEAADAAEGAAAEAAEAADAAEAAVAEALEAAGLDAEEKDESAAGSEENAEKAE